jgi:hypothetical protein
MILSFGSKETQKIWDGKLSKKNLPKFRKQLEENLE